MTDTRTSPETAEVRFGFASYKDGKFELIAINIKTGEEITLEGQLRPDQTLEQIDKVLPTCVYVNGVAQEGLNAPASTSPETAAYEDTDDAEVIKVLAAVRHCANSWEGSARLIGNVRARDISRACTAAIASLAQEGLNAPAYTAPPLDLDADLAEHRTYRDALIEGCARIADISGDNAATETGRKMATGIARCIRALAVTSTDREMRTGSHLLQTAKAHGWPDDGEGALEFMLRRAREVAFEDCGKSTSVTSPESKSP